MRQAMKNHWKVIPVFILVANCAVETDGIGTTAPPPQGSSSSGGTTPTGDAFPQGAVSFFRKVACPPDWEFYPPAHGRAIIAASDGLPRGTLIGEPLAIDEDRTHEHAVSAMVEVPTTEIAGAESCCNEGMTPADTYSFAAVSGPASSGVPYVRLLVCKKREIPSVDTLPLPSKLHMYFDLDACPAGWKPTATAPGRLVVGLPPKAPADLPFGGKAIISSEPRTHSHSFESTLVTSPHGVALVSGCCGKFGKNGTFAVAGDTDPVAVDIPMIALLHCEKE
jgi:hypothetical protein